MRRLVAREKVSVVDQHLAVAVEFSMPQQSLMEMDCEPTPLPSAVQSTIVASDQTEKCQSC